MTPTVVAAADLRYNEHAAGAQEWKMAGPSHHRKWNSMERIPSSQLEGIRLQRSSCEKHLDYNAPLLSVRRLNEYSTVNGGAAAVPQKPYKLSAELSAESLRKPGAVPFVWEQTPGKPKNKEDDETTCSSSPAPPQWPSCPVDRAAIDVLNEDLSLDYSDKQIMLEHNTDGSEKENFGSSPDCSDQGSFVNFLQQRGNRRLKLHPELPLPAPASHEKTYLQSRRWSFAEEAKSRAQPHINSPIYHSENDDSVSEATDTMAPTDAVATTCRVSVDGFDGNQLLSQTGREARDFIMHRFLPAAKAMACDSPANSGRRPIPEASKAIINSRMSRGPLPLTPRPPPPPARGRLPPADEEETEGVSKKACGIFPVRFRAAFLHSSRNPPTSYWATKKKGPSSLSRPGKLGTVIYEDTSSGSDDEEVVVREVQASLHERRTKTKVSGIYATGLSGNAGERRGSHSSNQRASDGEDTPNSRLVYYDAASRFSPQTTDRSGSGCISPYRNNVAVSPFHEGKRFLGLPKEWSDAVAYVDGTSSCFETPRASVGGENCCSRDSSLSPVSRANKSSSVSLNNRFGKVLWVDTTGLNGLVNDSVAEEAAAAQEHGNNEDYLYAHESYSEPGNVSLGGSGRVESFRVLDSLSVSKVPKTSELHTLGCSDIISYDDWSIPEPMGWPLGMSVKVSDSPGKVPPHKKLIERDSPVSVLSPPLPQKSGLKEIRQSVCSPPLPKSPSESWLWRALPLNAPNLSPISNIPVAASLLAKKQLDFSSTPAKVANWESIVKGDHVQSGQLGFSEELLHHRSCNSIDAGHP